MLPMESTPFSICSHTVRQDEAGRYCLNDLHKAAGGEKRHQPANFLRTNHVKELAAEILAEPPVPHFRATEQNQALTAALPVPHFRGTEQNQPLMTYQGGDGRQGTYVCKELVYAYAMWISPKFHLHVIRTFDAVVQAQLKAKDAKYDRLYDKYDREDLNHVCDSMITQQQIRSLESEVQELRSDLDALRVDRDAYHHCLVACEHEMGEQKQEIADLRLDLSVWKPKSLQ